MNYGIDIFYGITDDNLNNICKNVLSTQRFKAIEFFYGKDVVNSDFDSYIPKIINISEKYSLEVVIHLPMYDLALNSKRIKKAILEEIEEIVEFAGTINCKKLITHSGSVGNVPSNHLTQDEFSEHLFKQQQLVASMLQQYCDIAKKHDLIVCLENLFSKFMVGNYSKDIITIKNLVDRENLKFNYDTGHGNLIGEDVGDYIRSIKDDIMHLHLHDNDGRVDSHDLVCTGTVKWYELIDTLYDIEYDQILMFETKSRSDKYLLKMLDDMERIAAEVLESKI
jgi:sugar phosphate isomerase/epimerase